MQDNPDQKTSAVQGDAVRRVDLDRARMSVATDALAAIANAVGIVECPTPWIENTQTGVLAEIRRRSVETEELRRRLDSVSAALRVLQQALTDKLEFP